ncbi:hypothetical protein TNCV_971381 [Trichonephila clavipes]|nr:hypothetical protein TNCV_971381 [Trichonephila clavipes]
MLAVHFGPEGGQLKYTVPKQHSWSPWAFLPSYKLRKQPVFEVVIRELDTSISPIFCERKIRSPPLPCKFEASLPSSSGRRARFLGGQKGVALHLQDARMGVGSTKKPTPLDVDVRRSDVTKPLLVVQNGYGARDN